MSVEKIYTTNAWTITNVSWSGHINTISDLGVTQLEFYYRVSGATTWIRILPSSYSSTFVAASLSVSLVDATYDVNGSPNPANLDPATHEIRIKRNTSLSPYIEFKNGAKLDATDLNTVGRQALHRIEEEAARLDAADAAIYAYVDNRFLNYYTKAQIDEFFNTQTVPNWEAGRSYVVGDTVLHNDPNDAVNTLLVWYATVDHNPSELVTNEPSATGNGPSFWSVVAPNDSIANLSFIRRSPGIITTENEWNTITPNNVNATGLSFQPKPNHVASMLDVYKQDKVTKTFSIISGSGTTISNGDRVWLRDSHLISDNQSWFASATKSSTVFFNFKLSGGNPSIGTDNPIIAIRPRTGEDSLQVYGANNINRWSIDSNGKMTARAGSEFEGVITFKDGSSPIQFLGSEGHIGTGLFGFQDTPVMSGKDFLWGYPSGGQNDAFTQTASIIADNGNITTTGNVTSSGTVQSNAARVTSIQNADYLKTDGSGNVIAGTGTPGTTRVTYEVNNSAGTSLALGDVVYLDNGTGKWTLSQKADPRKLAMGMIDNVVNNGNGTQNFNVVFLGEVTNSNWNLQVGNYCFLHGTGDFTQTEPSGSGVIVDPVGIAVSTTSIFVTPARAHKLPVT